MTDLSDRAPLHLFLDVVRRPLEVAHQEERQDDRHDWEGDLPESKVNTLGTARRANGEHGQDVAIFIHRPHRLEVHTLR